MPRNTMPNILLSCNDNNNFSNTKDQFLPIANINRIMKRSLPPNAKISKEAKEIVQECVSEFISFITGEASEKCQREKRKTINGDDLLWAMTNLGFEDYVEFLKDYLSKYVEIEVNCSSISSFVNAGENGAKISDDYHCGDGINEKNNKGFIGYDERAMESSLQGVEW